MKEKINSFDEQYAFLSNFYPCKVVFEGIEFPSSEHAYQASKTLDHSIRVKVSKVVKAGDAKKIGRTIPLRNDWEKVKIAVMTRIIRIKFKNSKLRRMLLETGDAELIEGNWWGDTFWGVCKRVGENHLGKILMRIREELRVKAGLK